MPHERIFGTLKSSPQHARTNYEAGIRLVTLPIRWRKYEPRPGEFDTGYLAEIQEQISLYRNHGLSIILDFSMHHPPDWIWNIPHSRFVNQYGACWQPSEEGRPAVNGVFNRELRNCQEAYAARVLKELDEDFFAIRLGWLTYGELHYPFSMYDGQVNCYWAFDNNAQGKADGLPAGVSPCPVPDWVPGTWSHEHSSAREFLKWYLESLHNYHDWQITTVRKYFSGQLAMMYASWGIRPGEAEKAVMADLAGTTQAEQPFQSSPHGGQIQLGYDVARFVSGIKDPNVLIYSTTLGALPSDRVIDDDCEHPTLWSPVHYLHRLVQAHKVPLRMFGENAGNGSAETMNRCFERMERYGLIGLVWAFENQLYETEDQYASLHDYSELIKRYSSDQQSQICREHTPLSAEVFAN
jgi:hypothetical protein